MEYLVSLQSSEVKWGKSDFCDSGYYYDVLKIFVIHCVHYPESIRLMILVTTSSIDVVDRLENICGMPYNLRVTCFY